MAFLFRKKRQTPAQLDALTIEALKARGVDLTRERDVRHHLYFPSESDARRAESQLRSEGYRVEARPAAQGSEWLALASHATVVSETSIAAVRARLEALARSLHGEYDGWEAAAD